MDAAKLDIASPKNEPHSPTATYKQIPEDDMEEAALSRPKSLLKADPKKNEPDGAHEKMLPDEEKKVASNSNVNLAEVKFTNNDKQNGDAKLDIGANRKFFSQKEKDELLEICLRHKAVIENRRTDCATNKQKHSTWEAITRDFNSQNINIPRTMVQIKNFYENTKRKMRRKNAARTIEQYHVISETCSTQPLDSGEERPPTTEVFIKEEAISSIDSNAEETSDMLDVMITDYNELNNLDASCSNYPQTREVKSEFVGLTKEELMKYANDPFWVRLRWFLFIMFWLLWAGMLVGAILIIVAAPKCAPPEPKTWWEEGPLAEADSTASADDLNALKANGIMGLIVPYPDDTYKPFNESSIFATFLKLADEKKLKVIVELTPGVSNMWFDKSEAKEEEFNEYYIWAGREGAQEEMQPPNNWLSKNSTDDNKKSAWQYSSNRKQYYLAPASMPQLNFRSEKVADLFSGVLSSFLDAGVDGIRLRGAPNLLVDSNYANESLETKAGDYQQYNYNFYTHTKTENLAELGPLLKQWKDIIRNKTENGVFMLAEDLYTLDPYKINETLVIDLPRQSQMFMERELTAPKLYKGIESALKLFDNRWPLWEVKATDLPAGVLDVVAYLLKGSTIIQRDVKLDQELIDTRKSPSIMFGSQSQHLVANDTVFAYVRVHSGNPGFVVAVNPSDERVTVDFPSHIPEVTEEVTVQYLSKNYNETDISVRSKTNAHVFPMPPKSSVVLSYVPKEK